jgi:hypothetical protein
LDAGGANSLAQAANAFVRAGQKSDAAVRDAGAPLLSWLSAHDKDWISRSFTKSQVSEVRRSLVRFAAEGRMGDFAAAEQSFLGIESLSIYLGDAGRLRGALDAMFKTVEDSAKFSPGKFAASAKGLQAAL